MKRNFLLDSVLLGKWAGFTTSAAVTACGAHENGEPIAPVNAISHIAWGDEAFAQKEASLKYTATGLALNTSATISWAVVYELLWRRCPGRCPVSAVGCGAAVSLLAYIVDFHLVPPRLTPGFEKHLSRRSLLVVYTVLALSLASGALVRRK